MNRLLIRRCSMSSIEEEDESIASDELITQIEKLPSSPLPHQQQFSYHSPSVLEWDSELSESEQEFGDNNEDPYDNGEEQAASRALQTFIQSCSRTQQISMNDKNSCYSPFSIHLYDEEDSAELDVIISELRDFKVEFNDNSNLFSSQSRLSIRKPPQIEKSSMNHYPSAKSSSLFSTNGCVSELRTLEDQLEAALASLTLTINDCSTTNIDSPQPQQQHSSDSSACSSGLGDEIANESFHLYHLSNPNHHTISLTSKLTTTTDDCDSAFSDSGSTDKMTLPNPNESILYRSITNPIQDPSPLISEPDDSFLTHSQHPSKILVRTYNDDGSTKSIFIDDSMLIRDVLFVLIHKNHREPDINYTLIEILPDLHMERIFEDHQKLTEAILMWPTISSNRLSFTKRLEKYPFGNPQEEFVHPPDTEGNIYLKEKSRKSWKKFFCVLRSSGLYFIPKGKSKKDLVCLAKFENVELFFGLDWKKKFKSPSDFCFALKHPLIQKKSSKYIKYMCVETKNEFDRWIRNIRIAKFGQQLKMNYLLMDKAMSIYRSSGRFVSPSETAIEQQHENNDLSIHDCQPPIVHNQYYAIHSTVSSNDNDNSPIKSASYMDELRQRLERVLNAPPQQCSPSSHPLQVKEPILRPTLIPPPKFKSTNSYHLNSTENLHQIPNKPIKPPMTIGSTPLPRKQIQSFTNLSYRTINTPNRHPQQQQMSKSFILPSKHEDHRSASLLSITSQSDSLNLPETDFSPPSSTFLNNLNPTVNPKININSSKKPSPSFRTNPPSQSPLPIKNRLPPSSLKPTTSILKQNKPINSLNNNNKSVPPIPPRKSSIPRPALKPPPPQRNSSSNLLLRKSHVSHL